MQHGAGGQRVGQDGTFHGAGHHHNRHVSPVIDRANPRNERHTRSCQQVIAHEHGIV
jgi:hypothetical protein